MAVYLRQVRLAQWFKNSDGTQPTDEQLRTAANNLRGKDTSLSVFDVADDHSNLERVAAAYGGCRDNLSNLDYVLLRAEFIGQVGAIVNPSPGNTSDTLVNTWHYDIAEPTDLQLRDLCRLVLVNEREPVHRISKSQVCHLIAIGVEQGNIDQSLLKLKADRKLVSEARDRLRLDH